MHLLTPSRGLSIFSTNNLRFKRRNPALLPENGTLFVWNKLFAVCYSLGFSRGND